MKQLESLIGLETRTRIIEIRKSEDELLNMAKALSIIDDKISKENDYDKIVELGEIREELQKVYVVNKNVFCSTRL